MKRLLQRPRTSRTMGAAVAVATALLVFCFPLAISVPYQQTISASYVAGFNNHAAMAAALAISLTALLWSLFQQPRDLHTIPSPRPTPVSTDLECSERRLSISFVSLFILASCTFSAVAGWMVEHSHLRYISDLGYFLEQMEAHQESGRVLYSSLEFAYGPLLFYPTIVLHAVLRCSWLRAYLATLMLDQSIGLGLLAFSLNALPIRASHRKFVFALFALGALNPLLGLNYTFLRFMAPTAGLLICTQTDSVLRASVLSSVWVLLLFGISPELALAFLVGVACYAILNQIRTEKRWLIAFVGPVCTLALVVGIAGRPYLHMLASFSRGSLNLPVAPYPHILIFLFALVWLVPVTVGAQLRSLTPESVRLASCYCLALGLLPAAFGRSDPLHVFFNGSALLVLSLVGLRSHSNAFQRNWLAALLVLVCWQQWVNNRLYIERTADTVRLALLPHVPRAFLRMAGIHPLDIQRPLLTETERNYRLDVSSLERIVGQQPVATPIEISLSLETALKKSQHYRSDFYCFFVDVFNAESEARKTEAFNQAQWALLPADPDTFFTETPRQIDGVQGFTFPYPSRHRAPYQLGKAFIENLDENWAPVKRFGPYVLYHRSMDSDRKSIP